ncbi:hypothetical protein [Crateriforma conspicua]|uniref:hypothetical protein n=1 Tax=Crateriforma conspicua TaxID=2527996 RepID=UPI0011A66BD2|nr:hypothetical protein [Crateriforma conspicua]
MLYAATLVALNVMTVVAVFRGIPYAFDSLILACPLTLPLLAAQYPIAKGAFMMWRREPSPTVIWSARLSCVPFASPFYFLGIPFGVAALHRLRE